VSSSTFSIEVTGLTYTKSYRFKIIATNHIGAHDSNIVRAICADLPETPMIAPTFIQSETNTTSIRVVMAEVIANGGNDIISYHL